jgi:hypothetical protein
LLFKGKMSVDDKQTRHESIPSPLTEEEINKLLRFLVNCISIACNHNTFMGMEFRSLQKYYMLHKNYVPLETTKHIANYQLTEEHHKHGIKISRIGNFDPPDCKCNFQVVEVDDEECICSFVHICNCGKIITNTFGDPKDCTCNDPNFTWIDGKSRCNVHMFEP